MNKKSLNILEFNKIIDKLENYASSEGGKMLCRSLAPMTDEAAINDALDQTNDALRRIFAKGSLSLSGTRDIAASIKRLEVGSTLSAIELLNVSSTLDVARL